MDGAIPPVHFESTVGKNISANAPKSAMDIQITRERTVRFRKYATKSHYGNVI